MVLIFRDCDGIPDRLATLRATFPGTVISVCPHHAPQPGAIPIEIPDAWLPAIDRPRRYREWFAADALGLAAIAQLDLDPTAAWFVESDVWAPEATWHRIFTATASIPDDGIFVKLVARDDSFARLAPSFQHPGNPPWITHTALLGLYRLSRRAIAWSLAAAGPLRECYSEARVPSLIIHHGGTLSDLSAHCRYSAPRAFTGSAPHFVPGVMNHPVKFHIGKAAQD